MKKIAVTGGIASGKSTVCHLFEQLGAYVVSADAIVHNLLVPTTQIGKDLIDQLGADIVVNGNFDRRHIAQIAFQNPELLKKLEKRLHPEVQKVIETKYAIASKNHAPLFVAEVPLLYEAGLENDYDRVIFVNCEEKICMKRFSYGEKEFVLRTQRLMSAEEKIKRSDLVINNDGTLYQLRQTIQSIFNDLKENI